MAKIDLPKDVKGGFDILATYTLGPKGGPIKFSSDTISVKIDWKSIEFIEIQVIATYNLHKTEASLAGPVPQFGKGGFGYAARWRTSFTDKGLELDQDGDPKLITKKKHDGPAFDVTVDPKASGKKSSVKMVLPIVVQYESEGFSPELGPLGGGPAVLGTKEHTTSEVEYIINLVVLNQPAATKPKPNISRHLTSAVAYFEVKGKEKLPTSSLNVIKNWTNEIKKKENEELYQVLIAKKVPIYLEGNTSKSGSKEFNKKLAEQRIDAVERALNFHMDAKGLAIVKIPKGRSKTEEEHDYRVDISFDKGEAESAIQAAQK